MADKPKHWVKKSEFKPGGSKGKLHRALGVPEDEKIPASKLASAKNSKDTSVRNMAIRAETMKGWGHGGNKERQKRMYTKQKD